MSRPRDAGEAVSLIRASRPALEGSLLAWLRAHALLRPLDGAAVGSLYAITLATEYAYAEPGRLLPLLLARGELAAFASVLQAAARADWRLATVLVEAYPGLGFPLAEAEDDLGALFRAAAGAARGKAHQALRLCLEAGTGEDCRLMLSRLAVVARQAPGALGDCARKARELAEVVPGARVRAWLDRGADLMTSGRVDEGLKLLLLGSGEGRRMLGMSQVVLEDLRGTLRIYAASLAGRDLAINETGLSAFGIGEAYTDGATLFLPAEVGLFPEEELNRKACVLLAALEAASLRMGSFGLDLGRLPFRTELRARYGTLLPEIMVNLRRRFSRLGATVRERKDGEIEALFPSGRRLLLMATEHERLFWSYPTPELARELFRLAETRRLESALSALYPGLARDFALVNAWLWRRKTAAARASAATGEDDEGSVERGAFLDAAGLLQSHALLGRHKVPTTEGRLRDCVEGACAALDRAGLPGARVEDSAAAAFSMYNHFFEAFRLEAVLRRVDASRAFSDGFRPSFWPETVGAVRPELLASPPPAPAPPVAEDGGRERAIDLTSISEARKDEAAFRKALDAGAVRIHRYPEFDHRRGSYLPNHCTLFETSLPAAPGDWYEEVLARHAVTHRRALKRFLMMRPEAMEFSRGWYEGGEIHLQDAVDYCMSLRRGESPDEKIYHRKILDRRDLVVAVLLDASTSTELEVAGRRVIDIEKESLAVLAAALDALGDRFGLFTFSSEGPAKVQVRLVKDFDEGWDEGAWRRIGSIRPSGSNRDGCAIRHLAARLARRPERTKLLLMLSDGIPADIDYGAQEGLQAGDYAIEDSRRAIIEARRLGIVPFCLNIDTRAKSYISRLYGPWHYALLDDAGRLPERLSSLYLRLTG